VTHTTFQELLLHSMCMKFLDLKFWVLENTFAAENLWNFAPCKRFRPVVNLWYKNSFHEANLIILKEESMMPSLTLVPQRPGKEEVRVVQRTWLQSFASRQRLCATSGPGKRALTRPGVFGPYTPARTTLHCPQALQWHQHAWHVHSKLTCRQSEH